MKKVAIIDEQDFSLAKVMKIYENVPGKVPSFEKRARTEKLNSFFKKNEVYLN